MLLLQSIERATLMEYFTVPHTFQADLSEMVGIWLEWLEFGWNGCNLVGMVVIWLEWLEFGWNGWNLVGMVGI